MLLKQSTAFAVLLGPFVDNTDGTAPLTGLTLATTDITLSKNGTTSNPASITSQSHVDDGWYNVTLPSTAASALGLLEVLPHATGALPVPPRVFSVVPTMVHDALVGGTDVLQTDVTQWLGTAAATPTVAGVPEVDVTHWLGTAPATPTTAGVPEVDVTYVNGESITKYRGTASAVDSDSITLDSSNPNISAAAGTYVGYDVIIVSATTGAEQTAKITAYDTYVATVASWPAGTPTGTVVHDMTPGTLASAVIEGTVDANMVSAAAGVIAAATFAADALAAIQSEATDALNAYDPPTKAELDSAVAPLALEATLGTPADTDLASDIANVSAIGATPTEIWSHPTRLLSAGTNIVLAKGVGVTGFNDLSAAQVNAEADTAISDAALATAAQATTITNRLPAALVSGRIDASVGAMAANVVTDAALAGDTDVYQARVFLLDDDAGTTDRYVAIWFKNGNPVTSGITLPLINVYKVADGTDLIAETAMTEITGKGTYRYTATGAARINAGLAYVVLVKATIDGAVREHQVPVGRDAEAA